MLCKFCCRKIVNEPHVQRHRNLVTITARLPSDSSFQISWMRESFCYRSIVQCLVDGLTCPSVYTSVSFMRLLKLLLHRNSAVSSTIFKSHTVVVSTPMYKQTRSIHNVLSRRRSPRSFQHHHSLSVNILTF